MLDYQKTRFRKAEEALRFFFRVRELLRCGQTKHLAPCELPPGMGLVTTDALDDYRSIGVSMRGLDEVALRLLGEIYGPTAFGVHRRTFLTAGKAARLAFPKREFRRREIVLIHERALGVVRRGLREIGMIPGRPLRAARKQRPAAKTASRPLSLRVSWTASGA
jgi:hypothetical protein